MTDNVASTVKCPECGKVYKLGHTSPGKKARCRCGCEFELVPDGESASDTRHPRRLEISDDEALALVEKMAKVKTSILSEVGKVIVGQKEVLEQILTGFFAGGHCLLLGVPGLAKTLMVHSLAQTMHLQFKRIQFTPDLMPTDITGTNILEEDPDTHQRCFTFHRGPIFTNVL
ncbi:MAG: AAA family ATPase, partial [Sedimentisphaerales bacterium]|nr:AAA family ATPase [Sedimentisphaerales bacterium]